MNSTVHIQANNGYPFNKEGSDILLACRENQTQVKLFNHISQVPLNRYSIVVGSIENTHEFFNRMGWKIPDSMTLPDQLNSEYYTGRKIIKTTLREALKKEDYPFFIKSFELKKFIPGIIEKEFDKKWFQGYDSAVAPSTEVLVSDVLRFDAEYRVYVLDGKPIGCSYYTGDIKLYPEFNVVEDMIQVYDKAPKFYSLDVGIVKEGRLQFTYLVECNDGYSLGNYGLNPRAYYKGLTIRWRQLLEQNPVL